ncbi:MAG TPA: DUF4956 domain-containing protein [Dehalococcoidales bacterium]|nr:DUF4956 domain-containing protein [Dehalococcoidales bacterium]
MDEILNFFRSLESPLDINAALTGLGFSLAASIVIYFMYYLFYGSRHIGAGVHRTFIIGGPAITALFLGIQVSIPLSLGLLGALSFVRFRTPVKDPAEIGFMLLLIATSILSATKNFTIMGILLGIAFVSMGIPWLFRNRIHLVGRGNLMISVDQSSYTALENTLNKFLKERIAGVRLENMSVLDGRISLNYIYRKKSNLDWPAITNDLMKVTGGAKVEVYVG